MSQIRSSCRIMDMSDETTLTPRLDETLAFELFVRCAGSIPRMKQEIAMMPEEEQKRYPKHAALYVYEKQFDWKERFDRMESGLKERMLEEVGLTYERVNAVASMSILGLSRRLKKALENDKLDVFNYKMLESLWRIQRTERGLPVLISQSNEIVMKQEVSIKASIEQSNPKLAEIMEKMSPEWFDKAMKELGGDEIDAPPALIAKR